MESILTEGGVQQLIEAEGLFNNRHNPTLQVINIRRVPANALTDVYWVSGIRLCEGHFLLALSSSYDMNSFAIMFLYRLSYPMAKSPLK
jgi:hypothetical protein